MQHNAKTLLESHTCMQGGCTCCTTNCSSQEGDIVRCREAPHLQLRVAEDHQLGAGVDVIAFDEGQVYASDSLQAREVWAPHPVLSVLLHHLLPETGLLTANRAHD